MNSKGKYVWNVLIRIFKFIGKAIVAVLIVLLTVVALIHIPVIQKQLTHSLSNYLSSKIDSRVEIRRFDFSILGNVEIEDLEVWDPNNIKILSAHKIEVTSSLLNLVSGDFIFDEIHIDGVKGQLIQHKDGLNIQFIIDAFQPKERQNTKPKSVKLQFNKVHLENIEFEYTSSVNGITVTTNLGDFISKEAELSLHPNRIRVDSVSLQHSVVNILSAHQPDGINDSTISKENRLLRPDFGSGFVFEIKNLEFLDNDFSFHQNQVVNTPKFDPAHVELKDIQISLSTILIREDTLVAALQSLSTQLPGFKVSQASGHLQLNRNRLVLSKFHLASNTNELDADLTGWYDLNSVYDYANVDITALCRVNPTDLRYFFTDSLLNHFNDWETTELALEGNYILGKGTINTLNVTSGNNQLHAEGRLDDVWNIEKLNWKNVAIQASIDSKVSSMLTPYLGKIKIPKDIRFDVTSSGNLKKVNLDGNIFTTWGNVKASGVATKLSNNIQVDMNLTGEKVDAREWLGLNWLGSIDLNMNATGIVGRNTDVELNGQINTVEIMSQPYHDIAFQSTATNDSVTAALSIDDPKYRAQINSNLSFSGPLIITNNIELDSFNIGNVLHFDSTLFISGSLKSKFKIDQSSLDGYVEGKSIQLQNTSIKYLIDTLTMNAMISATASRIEYEADHEKGNLVMNFDIKDSPHVIQTWSRNIVKPSSIIHQPIGTKAFDFNIQLENASLLQLLGIDVDDFSSLNISAALDEQKQTLALHATSGKLKGYGISLDTLHTNLALLGDSVSTSMTVNNLMYNSIPLGDLNFDMVNEGDTAITNLNVSNDSITTVFLQARILPTDSGTFIYPNKLMAFDTDYFIDQKNPIYIENKNIVLNHFLITRDEMQIMLNGDLSAFEVSFENADLTLLNILLSPDSSVINKGNLNGTVSYTRDQHLNLHANIDSLSLYHSEPFTIAATAVSEGNQVPFAFKIANASNAIDLKGQYFLDNTQVDASLLVDINNLELFEFLVSNVIDEMNGTVKGEATIKGSIQKPAFKGYLDFIDVGLTTVNPKLTFKIEQDSITLDDSAVLFNQFTIFDQDHHPLTVNGNITTKDYTSFNYNLQINADQYALINNPDSTNRKLKGLLVIDSDIKLTGNEKDTHVEAKIAIKDATNLTFVSSTRDVELLKTEGIVEFVDPALLLDSTAQELSSYFYDSLIATLRDLNLNSTISIEDHAVLRVVTDAQSGDFFEASGAANLELSYDRTGNVHLSGNYTVKKGTYRLSFYDLVKKNFNLVQGSSINWSGSPENGDLNIKALHTVQTNSVGLIGNEISENEKSIYKRSLDYEIGININGTIEKPIVTFSLDLPQVEKVNYPVLANKLERLKQPEFQSELNKQVFGLLVLGGFLPENSGTDINSSLIATTALSNSVNALLANQLNRFATQYIKGVNIDVGIQSYSDYSAPGGKTQTAMDFRVSKSIMDDRLSFEIGGDFDINQDQSGANTGTKNYRGDVAIIYDLTGNGDKKLKVFNNETYDIIYQEIRNTGISIIFIREFTGKEKKKKKG